MKLNEEQTERLYRLAPAPLPEECAGVLRGLPEQLQPRGTHDLLRLTGRNERNGPLLQLRLAEEWGYDGGNEAAGLVAIDLNAGPDPVDWIVVNDGNYEQLKQVAKLEPMNRDEFWLCLPDVLASSRVAFHMVTQTVGDLVLSSLV